jgi:hypothetical protein
MSRVNSRTIYRWVEADKLHFTEALKGSLSICLNSIPHRGEAIDRQINSNPAKPAASELQLAPQTRKEIV